MKTTYVVVITEPTPQVRESDDSYAKNLESVILDGLGYPDNVKVEAFCLGATDT